MVIFHYFVCFLIRILFCLGWRHWNFCTFSLNVYTNKEKFRFEKVSYQLRNDFIEVTVLNYIHEVINGGREVCSPPCFVHKIFGINSFERVHFFLFLFFLRNIIQIGSVKKRFTSPINDIIILFTHYHTLSQLHSHSLSIMKFECQCGATSEPLPSSSFIYHVYTSELRYVSKEITSTYKTEKQFACETEYWISSENDFSLANTKYPNMPFDKLLAVVTNAEKKKCPEVHNSIEYKFIKHTVPLFMWDLVDGCRDIVQSWIQFTKFWLRRYLKCSQWV